MEYILEYFNELFYLTLDMAPYLLFGFIFAGILKAYVSPSIMTKHFGKNNFSSIIKAALFGVPLPLCSCGVIPAGISMHKEGASRAATQSFIISTPQTGVDSIFATYALLGFPMAIIRPIVALITGIAGGWITFIIDGNKTENLQPVAQKPYIKNRFLHALRYAFIDFVADIARWLVIGLLLAALIATLIPDGFFEGYFNNGFLGMLIILLVSLPLYVCATGSIPIAAVLMAKGFSPGAAFVFLMAGPATNLATITVLGKVLGKRFIFVYLLVIISFALLAGLLIDYLLPVSWFHSYTPDDISNFHFIPYQVHLFAASILVILIIYSAVSRWIKKSKDAPRAINKNQLVLKVEGMNCAHCKANIEKNIRKFPNISKADADYINGYLHLEGEDFNIPNLKETIEGLGYKVKDI